MKESYGEGLATHAGPESWTWPREGSGKALTGVRVGPVLSREIALNFGVPTVLIVTEGNTRLVVLRVGKAIHPNRETMRGSARSETRCMYGNTSRENREISWLPSSSAEGRVGKSKDTRQ